MGKKYYRGVYTMSDNETRILTGDNGTIAYSNDVIATIAGLAATDVEGVAGLSGGIAGGLAELLGKKNLTNGVKVEVGNEEAAVDISIVINQGVVIPEVTEKVQADVKHTIETMTGLRVVGVNVYVQAISFDNTSANETQARVR